MYTIEKIKQDNLTIISQKNSETGEQLQIIPDIGAMVHSIALMGKDGTVTETLAQDTPDELIKNPLFRGRILFPFNDIIPFGKYCFNNHKYKLECNLVEDDLAMHGFLYKMPLTVVDTQCSEVGSSVTCEGSINPSSIIGYPFSIRFSVTFSLMHKKIKIQFNIFNYGKIPAPVALGWHPYFSLGKNPAYARFECASKQFVAVDSNDIPTGEMVNCKGSEYDFINTTNIYDKDINIALTVPENGSYTFENSTIKLLFTQDRSLFKYIQLYIPEDGKSIAIEPITAPTNSFNIPESGLVTLLPQKKFCPNIQIESIYGTF